MKKTIILCLAIVSLAATAVAQDVVTGKVVDKKGNPIFGARVELKGTNQVITTHHDGTFTFDMPNGSSKSKVRAQYVGYCPKKQTAEDDMTIVLKEDSWWNWSPERGSWFLGVQGLVPEYGFKGFAPGLTLGWVKNAGFYLKGFIHPHSSVSGTHSSPYNYYTGRESVMNGGFSAGSIVRLKGHIYLYVGYGYGRSEICWETDNGRDKVWHIVGKDGGSGMLDAGLMAGWKHLLINAGLMVRFSGGLYMRPIRQDKVKPTTTAVFMPNFGVSYSF